MATLRSIFPLLVGVWLVTTGHGLLATMVSLRLTETLSSATLVGVIVAGYFAGLTLGSLVLGHVIKSFGHIRTFTACAAGFAAVGLLHDLIPEGPQWFVLRVAQGFCIAGVYMCMESWLNDQAAEDGRGLVLSIYVAVIHLGLGGGQLLLLVVDPFGGLVFTVATLVMIIAVVPVALTGTPAPPLPVSTILPLRILMKASPLGVMTTIASGILAGAYFTLGPVFASETGLSGQQVGLFMAALTFGGLVLQFPLGRMSDQFDRRLVLVGLFAVISVAGLCSGLMAATVDPIWSYVMMAGLGGLIFTLYPLGVAHTYDFVASEDLVGAAASLVLIYSFASILGPILAALVMDAMGPAGLFMFSSVITGAMVVFSLYRHQEGDALPPEEEHNPYLAIPRTTPVAAYLDPRAEEDQLSFDFDAAAEDDAPETETPS